MPLSNLVNLTNLYLSINNITDVSALKSLINLQELRLDGNQIRNIAPLIENSGLNRGDQLLLQGNNLDIQSGSATEKYIYTLEQRGVVVQPSSGLQSTTIQIAQTQSSGGFWTIVWILVIIVVVLGLALKLSRRRSRNEIIVCANGHRVSRERFKEYGGCPMCGTDLYHGTGRDADVD